MNVAVAPNKQWFVARREQVPKDTRYVGWPTSLYGLGAGDTIYVLGPISGDKRDIIGMCAHLGAKVVYHC